MRRAEPNFDLDYNEKGMPGERFAEKIRIAIYRERIEVKTDHRMVETGNLYLEFEQKSKRTGWTPSGIANEDTAELWMFASPNQDAALVISINRLRAIAQERLESCKRETDPWVCRADPDRTYLHEFTAVGCTPTDNKYTNPTHGIVVPWVVVVKEAWSTELVQQDLVATLDALGKHPYSRQASLFEGV